ncbi:GNAT family N-acetyltransferase [Mucilaginibacter mali]|uniref:GNAT family N-acetyltransferase n=1 Tax=Mucilaginibacter mali TaxID=2740462 RepID=A0A7D4UJM3_9SPHI|nr:GNAT family N-acetyltransferase [Mucilaginibacter mali]QKJ29362.1 GNAT family N-acetyltransferase [Mucilaginibacter mali]
MLPVTFTKLTLTDVKALTLFSNITFFDAFYHLNKPEDILAYADKFLNEEKLSAEIAKPNSAFYFAQIDGEIAGYTKINFAEAQSDIKDPASLEIERVYVSKHHQGKQIGAQLLNHAVQIARKANLQYIWLGVWEQNHRAVKFYQQNGFEVFGSHDFLLGSDLQTDLLMRKSL